MFSEALESRQFLSATLNAQTGLLTVASTANAAHFISYAEIPCKKPCLPPPLRP